MAIQGYKERALLRRGYHIQEALKRRPMLNETSFLRRNLIKEDSDEEKFIAENFNIEKVRILCTSSKEIKGKEIYCKIFNEVIDLGPEWEKKGTSKEQEDFLNSINFIYKYIRKDLEIDNRTTFLLIADSCLRHSNPQKAFELIAQWMADPKEIKEDGTVVSVSDYLVLNKIKGYVKSGTNTDLEKLESFLMKIRAISYSLYEKSFVGKNFSRIGGYIELEHGFDKEKFIDVIQNILLGKSGYSINAVIEKMSQTINNMDKSKFLNKADLEVNYEKEGGINKNISIKSNGVEILKSGDKVEVKKMNYKYDSYFSEFFSIYKNPEKLPEYAKTPQFVKVYSEIINGVYNNVKNNKNILNFIKDSLKGIMFDDYTFIKMEDIELYWSNAGARDCEKEPRLSIRYRVSPKNGVLTKYYYDTSHSNNMPSETIEGFTSKPEKKC